MDADFLPSMQKTTTGPMTVVPLSNGPRGGSADVETLA